MNAKKLKAKILLMGKTIEMLLKELDDIHGIKMDRSTFYRKMNGISEFDRREIIGISIVLNMSDDEIMDIFFEEKVS